MPGHQEPRPPRIGWLAVDSTDPESLGAWWRQLLGGTVEVDEDGDVRLEGGPIPVLFLRVPEAKSGKNRVHLDLAVDDFDVAVAAALELGATRADDIYAGDRWQVLRDPEGNEFCIIKPSGGGSPD